MFYVKQCRNVVVPSLWINKSGEKHQMLNARNWPKELTSREQLNLFNAACGDLASQISWHGFRLSKDDFRHLIAGTILGWRTYPGIDRGEGAPGLIMLGGSSLDLNRQQCTDAITQAFVIGDDPSSQGLNCAPVRWCKAVCGARWIVEKERMET